MSQRAGRGHPLTHPRASNAHVTGAITSLAARLEESGSFVYCVCDLCAWSGPRRRGVRAARHDAAEHALLSHDLPPLTPGSGDRCPRCGYPAGDERPSGQE